MNLPELFKAYLLGQKKKPSEATLKNYLADIRQFITWFEASYGRTFHPSLLNRAVLDAYTQAKTVSETSLQRHLSSLRKFTGFLQAQGYLSSDPFAQFQTEAKKQKSDPWEISAFKQALNQAGASSLTIKNYLSDLGGFINWTRQVLGEAKNSENPLAVLSQAHLTAYQHYLSETFSQASAERKLSSLRKYLKFAEEKGLLEKVQVGSSPVVASGQRERSNQNQEIATSSIAPRNGDSVLETTASSTAQHLPKGHYPLPHKGTTFPEGSRGVARAKTYSSFPPLRLMQKTKALLMLGFDATVVAAAAVAVEKVQYLSWLASGKQVFVKSAKNVFAQKDKLNQAFFIHPAHPSFTTLPKHKKILGHARYTRPNWYHKYHSYRLTSYFHLAALVIMMTALTFGMYNALFADAQKNKSLAAPPTAPPRVLSFQGRLTDSSDNPIDSAKALRFAIYNDQSASGSALLWQEVQSVTPDADGIFSVYLGNGTAIPASVFSQNSSLYLGVTVETDPELAPRQQIATVGFAANSETLQGLLPITAAGAGTNNVVLALDSSGNLTIGGSATPTFQATGGAFTLSGNVLNLSTTAGSNSNVNISPDGLGTVNITKPIQNTSLNTNIPSAAGAVEIDDMLAVLATSSGQSALTLNQNGAGPLISASASGNAKFSINNSGVITANNYGAGVAQFNSSGILSSSALSLSGTLVSGQLPVTKGGTGLNGVSTGDLLYGSASNTLSTLPIGTTGKVLTVSGGLPAWVDPAILSGSNFWQLNTGALAPLDVNNDLLLGGNATSSAKFAFLNNNGTGTPTASISGNLSIKVPTGSNPATSLNILNGGSFNIQTATTGQGDAGITSRLFISNNGNIGIGSTIPAAKLDVNGTLNSSGNVNLASGSITTNTVAQRVDLTQPFTYLGSGAGASTVRINASSGSVSTIYFNGAGGTDTIGLQGGVGSTSNLRFLTSSTTQMMIDASGNVGVGTTNPANFKLQVAGSVGPTVTNTYDLGSAALQWRNLYTQNIYQNGALVDLNNYWQETLGALAPKNITDDVLIGGSATSSALTKFAGLTGGNSYFNTGGNVGIGTTSPGTILDLYSSSPTLSFRTTGGTNQPDTGVILFSETTTTTPSGIKLRYDGSTGTGGGEFLITDVTSGTNTDLVSVMRNGNVGLGSTTPTAKLDVAGDASLSGSLVFNSASAQSIDILNGTALNIKTSPGGDTGLATQMTILSNGNVGIGSTAPTRALDVENSTTETASVGVGASRVGLSATPAVTTSAYYLAANSSLTLNPPTGVTINSPDQNHAAQGGSITFNGAGTVADVASFQASSIFYNTGTVNNYEGFRVHAPVQGGSASVSNAYGLYISSMKQSFVTNGYGIYQTGATDKNYFNGNVGIGTNNPISPLEVYAGTTGGNAAAIVDQRGASTNDIFTASASGTTRFVVGNDGTLTATKYTTNGGLLYTNGSGVIAQTGAGTGTQCLLGGATPTWGACSTGGGITGSGTLNYLPKFTPDGATLGNSQLFDNGTNVGIGSTTPGAFLDVNGSIKITPSTGNAATTNTAWINTAKNTISLFLGDGVSTSAYGADEYSGDIRYNGSAVAWGDVSYYPNGNSGYGSFRFTRNGSTVAAQPNARVGVGGLYSNGNVGIGSTTPGANLDVVGTARVSGVTTLSNYTTNGGLLYTNGSGVVAQTGAGISGQALISGGAGAPSYGTLGLVYGGTNADLSGVATGGLLYKGASALAGTGALTGVLKGNGSSAPTAMNGTANYVTRWTDANTLGIGVLYDNSTNVGIGSTAPTAKLDIAGNINIQGYATASASLAVGYSSVPAGIGNGVFSGNVGIGSTLPAYKLDVSGGSGIVAQFSGRVIGGNAVNTNEFVTLGQLSAGAGQYWQRALGALSPSNITDDVLIGGTATSSALIKFAGLTNGNSYFNTGGNLGIGTTSPSSLLHLAHATVPGSGADTKGILLENTAANSLTGQKYSLDTGVVGVNDAYFGIQDVTNNAYRLVIKNDGNIGIGSTSPAQKLDVTGSIAASTNVYFGTSGAFLAGTNQGGSLELGPSNSAGSETPFVDFHYGVGSAQDYNVRVINDGNNQLSIKTNSGGTVLTVNGSNVGIGSTIPGTKLDVAGSIRTSAQFLGNASDTAAAPSFSWNGDTNLGLFRPGTDVLGFSTAGVERMRIDSAGNVGIGTTTAAEKLLVSAGNIGLDANNTSNVGLLYYKNGTNYQGNATDPRNSGAINAISGQTGRLLNQNPDFLYGLNGYSTYDNSGGGHTAISLTNIATAPNSTGMVMNIHYDGAGTPGTNPTPGYGGFVPSSFSKCSGTNGSITTFGCYREGERILERIWAKIPVGYNITDASNGIGTGGTRKWLTSQAGTGNWQEYILLTTIGEGGSFGGTGHKYLSDAGGGNVAFDWYVADYEARALDEVPTVDRAQSLNIGFASQSAQLGFGQLLTTKDAFLAASSGNVGIGTTSPTNKLEVAGTFKATGAVTLSNFTTNGGLLYTNASGVVSQTGAGTATQCLLGGTTPTWGACSTGGGVTGSGTANYLPKWNGTSSLSNSLVYDNGTNVGIGTTVPGAQLDVANTLQVSGTRPISLNASLGSVRIQGNAAGWAQGYFFNGSAGTDLGGFGAYGSSDALTYYWIGSAYNTPDMVVKNGNVGIGSTSPGYVLDVLSSAGSVARLRSSGVNNANLTIDNVAGGNQSSITFNDAGTAKFQIGKQTDNTFFLYDSANARSFLTESTSGNLGLQPSGGNVGIGTTLPGGLLSLGAGTLRFQGNSTLSGFGGVEFANVSAFGLKTASANYAFNAANGTTNYMTITSAGNVGIGSTAPGTALDVTGDIRTSATLAVAGGQQTYYAGDYSVPTATNVNINLTSSTSTLVSGMQYRIILSTKGTSTNTGAVFLVYQTAAGTWTSQMVSANGTTSNHPLLGVSGTNVYVYHNHASTYTIRAQVFGFDSGNTVNTASTYFGLEGAMTNLAGNIGIGSTTPGAKLDVAGNIQSSGIGLFNGAGNNYFAGNVGIGTTNPQAPLDVEINADATTAQKLLTLGNNFTGQNNQYTFKIDSSKKLHLNSGSSSNAFLFDNNAGTNVFSISNTGALTTAGTVTLSNYTTNGGLLYTNASGLVAQTGAGTATQCLLGGTSPTWGACSTGGGVTGSGTANYLPKWNGTSSLTNSLVYDNGTNVGIGTTTPQAVLDINGVGWAHLNNNGASAAIFKLGDANGWANEQAYTISSSDNGGSGTLSFDGVRWSNAFEFGRSSSDGAQSIALLSGSDSNQTFDLYDGTTTTVNARIASNGNSYFNGGNLGIGSTSPAQKLDVAGNINLSGATSNTIFYGGTGVAAPGAGSVGEKLQLYGTAGTIGASDYALGVESGNMWLNSNGGYKFYSQSSELMRIASNGNVGIGTTSTTQLLNVGTGFFVNTSGYAKAPGLALGNATLGSTDRLLDVNSSVAYNTSPLYAAVFSTSRTGSLNSNITDYGIYNNMTLNGTDGAFSHTTYANYNNLTLSNGNTTDSLYGVYSQVTNNSSTLGDTNLTATTSAAFNGTASNSSTGAIGTQYGILATSVNSSTGSISSAYGGYLQAYNNNASGSITTAYGARTRAFANAVNSSITTAYGLYADIATNSATTTGGINTGYAGYFTITNPMNNNAYGVYSNVTGTGTGKNYGLYVNAANSVTNNYGLFIANPPAAAGNYGIYENSTAQNYFNGNVGIGSTTPGAKLDVAGTLKASGQITFSNYTTNGGLLYTDTSGVVGQTATGTSGQCLMSAGGGSPTWGACSTGSVTGSGTANYIPKWNGTSSLTNSLLYDTGTNIGIGTTIPGYKLDVASGTINNQGGSIRQPGAAAPTLDGASWIYTVSGEGLRLATGGVLTLGTQSAGSYVERFRLASNGNVGIGSTSPAYKLDVAGDIRASGSVLSSTAAGNPGGNGFIMNYASSTPNSGPSLQWSNGTLASTIGLYVNAGLNFQGNASNPDFQVRTPTTDGTLGTQVIELGGASTTANSWFNGGNLGIGSTSPAAKLDVVGNVNIQGSTKEYFSGQETRTYRNVAQFNIDAANQTGTIKIVLPHTHSTSMVDIHITGYNYLSNGGAWEVRLGGYNYTTGWVNTSADITGSAPFTSVRFGNDGTNDVILLGDTSTVWQYPQIFIDQVNVGYTTEDGWEGPWTISMITDESAITANPISTPTIKTYVTASGNMGIGTTSPAQKLEVSGNTLANNYYVTAAAGNGIGFWNGSPSTYGTFMSNSATYQYGDVNDYYIANVMSNGTGRGFVWSYGSTPSMALNASSGNLAIKGTFTSNGAGNNYFAGNVGIGSTLPTQKLDVNGYVKGTTGLCINTDCRTSWPTGTVTGTGSTNYLAKWSSSTGLTNSLLYDNGTNVGIGTTNPLSKLQVGNAVTDHSTFVPNADSLYVTNQTPTSSTVLNDPQTVLLLGRQGTSAQAYGAGAAFNLSRYENNGVNSRTRLDISLAHASFDVTSNTIMTLLSNGNVGIGSTAPAQVLDVTGNIQGSGVALLGNGANTAPSYSFTSDSNTGMYDITADVLGFATAGSERVRIASNGNVGIGSVSPAHQLDVTGDIGANGTYYYGDNKAMFQYSDAWLRINPANAFTSGTYAGTGIFRTDGTLQVGSGGSTLSVASGGDLNYNAGQIYGGFSTGNVGIGSTLPTQKLDVNGYVKGTTGLCINTDCRTSWPTGSITGTGSTNYIAKWSSSTGLTNSVLYDDGTNIGIGSTTPTQILDINATGANIKIRGNTGSGTRGYLTQAGTGTYLTHNAAFTGTGTDFNADATTVGASSIQLDRGFIAFRTAPATLATPITWTEGMRIDSGGNVGIGSTVPGAKLDVQPTSGIALRLGRVSGSPSIKSSDPVMILDSAGQYLSLNHYVADNIALAFGGGNVGIGTTVPGQKLDVRGSVLTSAQFLGNAADTATAPSFSWSGDTNLGIFRATTDTLGFSTAGSERMRIASNGNVGIGSTSPTVKLDVAGNGKFNNLQVDASLGYDQSIYFTPQPYFEAGSTTAPFPVYDIDGFTTVNDTTVPFSKVALSSTYNQIYSDFIPVQPGDQLYGEIWAERDSGATGTAGVIYYGIEEYDESKLPIATNNGTNYFVASNQTVPTTGVWTKYSGTTTLPTSHTPFNGSDGGPVRYVRVRILVNYSAGTIPTRWGGILLRRVAPYRDSGNVVFNGNVGIGSVTPGAKLDVTGTLRASGQVTLSNYITNNGLLYTNGSGVVAQTGAGASGQLLLGTGAAPAFATMGGDATITSTGTLTLKNTGTAGTYGSASTVPVLTTDAQGRVTGVTNTSIAIAASQVTSGTLAIARGGTNATTVGSAGSVAYSTGSAYAFSGVGSSGDCLKSGATGSPTWGACSTGSVTGTGTTNFIAKFTSGTAVGNSLLFDNGTNVGIGTTVPLAKLDINGTASISGNLTFGNVAAPTIQTSQNTALTIGGSTTGNIIINPSSTNNVGIGMTTPGSDLQINGTVAIGYGTTATTGPANGLTVNGNVGIGGTTASQKLYVSGNAQATGTFFAGNGAVGTPAFTFGGDPNTGMYDIAADTLGFATAGAERMRIDASGNVGIGTTTTTGGRLSVSGGAVSLGTGVQTQFFTETGDKLYLYSNTYGIGIESSTLTMWSGSTFRWRTGGTSVSTGTESMVLSSTGNLGIGASSPTTAKLVINAGAGGEALDLSTSDSYANLRVLHNTNATADKDMYIGYQSGATSSLHLYSNNSETLTVKGGNIGIGSASPTEKIDVTGNIKMGGGTRWRMFTVDNRSGASNSCDSATSGTVSQWCLDAGSNGVSEFTVDSSGNIEYSGTNNPGGNPDIAEHITKVDPDIERGDILVAGNPSALNSDNNYENVLAERSRSAYDSTVIGIVSSAPGTLLGTQDKSKPLGDRAVTDTAVAVTLAGRIPTKVSTINGPIQPGDPITSSQIIGVGMKATKPGTIVGRALQAFTGSNDPQAESIACPTGTDPSVKCAKIMVMLNVSWYDPDVYITDAGTLNITGSGTSVDDFKAWIGQYQTDRKEAFSDAVIAHLIGGLIKTQQLVVNGTAQFFGTIQAQAINAGSVAVNSLTVGGQTLQDYILSVVQNAGFGKQTSVVSPVDQLATGVISPLDGQTVTVNGNLTIKKTASAAGSLSVDGNASISGTLSAQDASISGTLHAHKISADEIEGLDAKIASLSANSVTATSAAITNITNITNVYQSASGSATPSASDSATPASQSAQASGSAMLNGATPSLTSYAIQSDYADIGSLSAALAYVPNLSADFGTFNQGLISLGSTSLSDTAIAGQLSINGSFILSDNSINTLGATLEIQPLRQGNLSFMAGLMTLDTDGNLSVGGNATFAKNVTVNGTLAAKVVSPVPDSDLIFQLPGGSADQSTLAIDRPGVVVKNASGSSVLKLTDAGDVIASGAGKFANLQIIRGAQADTSFTTTVASGSAGTASIVPGETSRTIVSPFVDKDSLIYITATSDTGGIVPYVARQVAEDKAHNIQGSFTIQIPQASAVEININWWIVN